MANLTIKQLDDRTLDRLRTEARRRGLSLNKLTKQLLDLAVGCGPPDQRYTDLSEFAGTWSSDQVEEFKANTRSFTEIDRELWD